MVPRRIPAVDKPRSVARVLHQPEHSVHSLASLPDAENQEVCAETSGSARRRSPIFRFEEDSVHWKNNARVLGRVPGKVGYTFQAGVIASLQGHQDLRTELPAIDNPLVIQKYRAKRSSEPAQSRRENVVSHHLELYSAVPGSGSGMNGHVSLQFQRRRTGTGNRRPNFQ